jgi:hypothetical protein
VSDVRGRKLLVAVAVLAVLVAAGASVLWPRPDRITRENFNRIREGMTWAEVEAILGPPGEYRTKPLVVFEVGSLEDFCELRETLLRWSDDTNCLNVIFDPTGHVRRASDDVAFWFRPDPLELLLWRIERQSRKWFPE